MTDNTKDMIQELMAVPTKNLEKRIEYYKNEMACRRLISYSAQQNLSNKIFQLKERLRRLEHSYLIKDDFQKVDTERQLLALESNLLNETVSEFKDISFLKEKMLTAKEDFNLQKQRNDLLN